MKKGGGRAAGYEDLIYSIEVAIRNGAPMTIEGAASLRDGEAAHLSGLKLEPGGPLVVRFDGAAATQVPMFGQMRRLPRELEGHDDPTNLKWPVEAGPFRFDRAPIERSRAWFEGRGARLTWLICGEHGEQYEHRERPRAAENASGTHQGCGLPRLVQAHDS